MQIQGRHALPELSGRDGSVAVSIKEGKGSPHIEALEIEGRGHLVKDLVKTALSEVCRLEVAAEFLDVHFPNLRWVSNAPEETMLLHREWKVELPDPLLEVTNRYDTGLRIERVVKAVEAVEEGDISLLKEPNDSAL